MADPRWLVWARRLQAIAQTGLEFAHTPFDTERYQELQRLAAEMMAERGGGNPDNVLALFRNEQGYATPKLAVRAAVFKDDKLLFVREKADGRWTVPGGWMDVGDSARESVEHEVEQESGYEVRATKLLMVQERSRHPHPPFRFAVISLWFDCELVGGAPRPSIETDAVDFFAENALPELSITRILPEQVARLFHHHRNPQLPTEFD